MSPSGRPRIPRQVAAFALALAPAVATSTALAQETDSQVEGQQDPSAIRSPDPADNPGFRPPRGPTRPDQDAGPVAGPDAPTNDAEGDPVDEGQAPPPQSLAAPTPTPRAPTPPATTPAPPRAPAAPPPLTAAPAPTPVQPLATSPPPRPRVPVLTAIEYLRASRPAPSPPSGDRPSQARSLSAPVAATRSGPVHPAAGERATVAGGSYRVRPGDSLWTIAERVAGPGASQATIARLVDRIWQANRSRIGTGDPDLLAPGTVIRLSR